VGKNGKFEMHLIYNHVSGNRLRIPGVTGEIGHD
jgi:hypothetical protein